MLSIKRLIRDSRGDTIVEVLIAIGIAAFAIGITYATAQHSLHTSITAKEHNQALNLTENQISDIKLRFQNSDTSSFNSNFTSTSKHFCLGDSDTTQSSGSSWTGYTNSGLTDAEATSTASIDATHYDPNCVQKDPGGGFSYYVDVHPIGTSSAPAGSKTPVTYLVTIRWEPVGGGQINKVSQYYRVNGGTPQTLGAVTTSGTGNADYSNVGIVPPTYSYDGGFKNISTNPPSEVTGCVWDWGDGTAPAVNQACQYNDQIQHHFLFIYNGITYSNYTSPDPAGIPPCYQNYTITLTIYLNDGPPVTHTNVLGKPAGGAMAGKTLCS
jgi:Tfp pilus assembly protein PilV